MPINCALRLETTSERSQYIKVLLEPLEEDQGYRPFGGWLGVFVSTIAIEGQSAGPHTFHDTSSVMAWLYVPANGEVIGFCPLVSAAFTTPRLTHRSSESTVRMHRQPVSILGAG